jgi:large subunit ribosomal protein L29
MRASELRGQSRENLQQELQRLQQELFDLRFQWQGEESPDTSRKGKIRRDIARVKTVLREMQLAESTQT